MTEGGWFDNLLEKTKINGGAARLKKIDDNSTPQENNSGEIDTLKEYIKTAEENLESAKLLLSKLTGESFDSKRASANKVSEIQQITPTDGKIVEGTFDGENMIGPEGKTFSVPANYASKSKLVEGDRLKLTVAEDGSFIFKQIAPVERRKVVGVLNFANNFYKVSAEGKEYDILYASVTYHKAKPGDKVTIVVPAGGNPRWAALENIVHDIPETVSQASGAVVSEPISPELAEQAISPTPEIARSQYVSEETQQAPEQSTVTQTMPEESFLPRTQNDETNSLGEGQPVQQAQATVDQGEATELEI